MITTNEKRIAVVVIPTYNEADNIGRLIEELCTNVFPKIDSWKMKILVVDGRSTDGTADRVRNKSAKYPEVDLMIEEEKGGIGSAYLQGFAHSIDSLKADVVMEFDADFQHPPQSIPILLSKIDEGYDYVLGSRKIEGGGEAKNRSLFRKLLTEVGGTIARIILFFPGKNFMKVTDPTTGLKATRVKGILDSIDLDPNHLYSRKFGYKIQLLSEILEKGARYAEIPLVFGGRGSGSSKIEIGTFAEILLACLKTRIHEPSTNRFLRFATVGFIGYLINALFIEILPHVISQEALVWLIATECAIASNFTLNNIWTFSSARIFGNLSLGKKFLQFNLSSGGALVIQTVFGTLAVSLFGEAYRQQALILIVIALVVPYNWYMYRRFIWKQASNR